MFDTHRRLQSRRALTLAAMASPERKSSSSGRTTPKGGPPKANPAKANRGSAGGRRGPDLDKPVAIGRRPSSPGFLAVVAVMWMAVAVVLFLTLNSSWKLVPVIVAFGIGVLFLRGAGATVLRRERRRSSDS
jgi:Flp pilus assembly protein TadB